MPLSGGELEIGQGIVNGVKLAVDDANVSARLGSARLVLDARDEGRYDDKNLSITAVSSWAADPRVIAMVGPADSPHAHVTIPITNKGGLLECSPANTDPGLTKARFGALDLRSAFPSRINYVRLATDDDIQGPAAASFAYNDLTMRNVLIVDDTSSNGRGVADSFQTAFGAFEQSLASPLVSRRALNPGATDVVGIVQDVTVFGVNSGLYFGGLTASGAPEFKKAADAALTAGVGGGTPRFVSMLSWDGLYDGSGVDDGSYIQRAGAHAAKTYVTTVSIAPVRADFDASYRAAFGIPPTAFAGAAHACAEIVIDALRHVGTQGVDSSQLREAVRAYVTDTSHRFATVLGTVGFDANGDSLQQFVTFYKVDMGALGGKGDWIEVKQQDFGPAS